MTRKAPGLNKTKLSARDMERWQLIRDIFRLRKVDINQFPPYLLSMARQYEDLPGYTPYSGVLSRMIEHPATFYLQDDDKLADFFNKDATFSKAAFVTNQVLSLFPHAPWYYLDKGLCEFFRDMDFCADVFENMGSDLPGGVFMLPKGVLKTPDGDSVDYIAYWIHRPKVDPELFLRTYTKKTCYQRNTVFEGYEGDDPLFLLWETTTESNHIYQSTSHLAAAYHADSHAVFTAENVTGPVNESKEKEFLLSTTFFLVQSILFLQNAPREIIEPALGPARRMARAKQSDFDRCLRPATKLTTAPVIAEGFTRKVRRATGVSSAHKGGSHASPRPHWRRAHTRRQRHGKGNKQIKRIEIPTTVVMPGGIDLFDLLRVR